VRGGGVYWGCIEGLGKCKSAVPRSSTTMQIITQSAMQSAHPIHPPNAPTPRDAIYWLDNVRRTVTRLMFMLLILPWFQVIFRVAWCVQDEDCQGKAYLKVRRRRRFGKVWSGVHGCASSSVPAALLTSLSNCTHAAPSEQSNPPVAHHQTPDHPPMTSPTDRPAGHRHRVEADGVLHPLCAGQLPEGLCH